MPFSFRLHAGELDDVWAQSSTPYVGKAMGQMVQQLADASGNHFSMVVSHALFFFSGLLGPGVVLKWHPMRAPDRKSRPIIWQVNVAGSGAGEAFSPRSVKPCKHASNRTIKHMLAVIS
jgi:hypothetical protein